MYRPIQVDVHALARVDDLVAQDHMMRQFRPTAVGVVQRDALDLLSGREVLFVKSAYSDDWNFLQGGIARGEKAVAGLFRELHEEVKIPAIIVTSCAFYLRSEIRAPGKVLRDGFNSGKSYYYFGVRCAGRPHVVLNTAEVADHKWLPSEEALAFVQNLKKRDRQKRDDMLRALEEALIT